MSPFRTSRCSCGDRFVSVFRSSESRRTSPLSSVTDRVGRPAAPRSRRFLNRAPKVVSCQPSGTITKLLQISVHFRFNLRQLALEFLALNQYSFEINWFLLLEGVHVTRDVEVVVVPFDLVGCRKMRVLRHTLSRTIGLDDLPDVIFTELVLV